MMRGLRLFLGMTARFIVPTDRLLAEDGMAIRAEDGALIRN